MCEAGRCQDHRGKTRVRAFPKFPGSLSGGRDYPMLHLTPGPSLPEATELRQEAVLPHPKAVSVDKGRQGCWRHVPGLCCFLNSGPLFQGLLRPHHQLLVQSSPREALHKLTSFCPGLDQHRPEWGVPGEQSRPGPPAPAGAACPALQRLHPLLCKGTFLRLRVSGPLGGALMKKWRLALCNRDSQIGAARAGGRRALGGEDWDVALPLAPAHLTPKLTVCGRGMPEPSQPPPAAGSPGLGLHSMCPE